MIYWLSQLLVPYASFFTAFDSLTLRAIMSVLTALTTSLWLGPVVIKKLQSLQIGQAIRDDGPKSHLSKAGTPTMGGVMILFSITASVLLWSDLSNKYVWITLFVMLVFGAVGWVDDYRKVVEKNPRGLPAKWKYLWLSVGGLSAAVLLYVFAATPAETSLLVPVFKDVVIPLGILFIPFAYFVIVGTSNAVNLSDGLDGLAILPTVLVGGALGLFAYLTGNFKYADYLHIPFILGAGELLVYCAAIVGAGFGFLWFNTYPAQVFMGDVGALALGGALGVIAVISRQELTLFIMGGIFVAETVSVILQVASFKMTGKRVFRMAPLHHHYELKGWAEPKVIVRFWIVTIVLVLVGLATLKVR